MKHSLHLRSQRGVSVSVLVFQEGWSMESDLNMIIDMNSTVYVIYLVSPSLHFLFLQSSLKRNIILMKHHLLHGEVNIPLMS